MKPSKALLKHRNRVFAILANRSLVNPRVFGSVSRGEDTEESDLDLLVDAPPNNTLFNLGGAQAELEELLEVKVDLLTSNALSDDFRNEISQDIKSLKNFHL